MTGVVRQFRDFFVSLKLTVWLLALSIILIFWATLTQADLGVWGVQQKFFHSFFVLQTIPGTSIPVPVYPGGYLLGGLLFINLVCAQIYRFKYTWRKAGIWLTHVGVILLLLGELLSGLMQQDSQMSFTEGQTKNYVESFRDNEVAITDTTDPKMDQVVAIPEEILARGEPVQNPQLPFRVIPKAYFPNADLLPPNSAPNLPPSLANQGPPFLRQYVPVPQPLTYKENEKNLPAAYVELVGPDGSLGTWLIAEKLPILDAASQAPEMVDMPPQHFEYGGRSWKISLRPTRHYEPYKLTLLKITNDIYPGTDIPKNFASRVRIQSDDGRHNREVVIYMNNPLRYGGLTYYQYQMDKPSGLSVLEVVRNPGWQMPYLACALIALGLVLQFCLHLAGFARKRRARSALAAPAPAVKT